MVNNTYTSKKNQKPYAALPKFSEADGRDGKGDGAGWRALSEVPTCEPTYLPPPRSMEAMYCTAHRRLPKPDLPTGPGSFAAQLP